MQEPAKPVLTDEAIAGMTAEQLSRAGVALRFKLEIPPGSEIYYDLLVCPTRDLKKHKGKAQILATYTELDGVCKAHAVAGGEGIKMLEGVVRFREHAEEHGLTLFCAKIVAEGQSLED